MQRTIRVFLVTTLTAGAVTSVMGRAQAATPAGSPAASPALHGVPNAAKTEPPIATPGAIGDYLRAAHGRLHGRWTDDFVKVVANTYPKEHALNTPSRQVTVAMAIRWDGTVAERTVKESSGVPEFDKAAMDIVRKSAPFPLPPSDVISDDSYAHLEWTFARDHRSCSAGARVIRVDDPLEISLPRLIMSNRVAEALRRIGQSSTSAAGDGTSAGLDRFARLYLGRVAPDPLLDVAASLALAESGDQSQVPRLRAALASRPTAAMAATGLRKLGIDVCEAVREPLQSGNAAARATALEGARSAAQSGADISGCRASLAANLADPRQPIAVRLQALEVLVAFVPPAAARPVIMASLEDKDPVVRGAVLLASVRKGAGRPEMYRLAPLLHDKTVEIRGAASAGMVRAGGDMALDQLYLLSKETDARPGTWVATELAQMNTRPSAELLGKMLRKNNLPVQVAAARALAGRKDPAARTELDAVKDDARLPGEVRQIASGTAPAKPAAIDERSKALAASEPLRQLLGANRGTDAAAWVLEHFQALEPRAGIEALGAWLARPASTASTPTPPSPPQTMATDPAP